MTKAQTHQIVVNENDLWETPPDVIDEAMIKYDVNPIIDICATFENKKFLKYFSPKINALNQEWTRDFFMNPPYSEITQWMKKAYEQHKKYNVNALILVFAKTGVQWWHDYVEGKAEVHFQKGRIRFLINGIEPRYCKDCKTRFIEEINHCKNCKRCNLCRATVSNGLTFCPICDSKLVDQKISKSSPTYDSAWVIFRSKLSSEV